MCSSILKVVFIVLLAIAWLLTAIALFTPGWRNYTQQVANHTTSGINWPSFGIVSYTCNNNNGGFNVTACEQYWNNQPAWEKAVIVFIVLALIIETLAFLIALVEILTCCCCNPPTQPLPVLTAIAALLMLIAVIIYGVKNQNVIGSFPNSSTTITASSNVGYSFWLALFALLALIIDTITGLLIVKTSQKVGHGEGEGGGEKRE